MSSSDSTGSSKPKQQLNISAKEWVPNKIISNLPQQHSTGNNYDYSQESVTIYYLLHIFYNSQHNKLWK